MILPKSASVGCVPPAHIPHGEYLMSQNGTSDILHSADRLSRRKLFKCCIAFICNVYSGN